LDPLGERERTAAAEVDAVVSPSSKSANIDSSFSDSFPGLFFDFDFDFDFDVDSKAVPSNKSANIDSSSSVSLSGLFLDEAAAEEEAEEIPAFLLASSA
jgi:hypothetical protein